MLALIALALALSMDAFAAALCQGAAAMPGRSGAVRVGAAFGAAQGLMPLIGWAMGMLFATLFSALDHWIALLLLSFLGLRMIRSGLSETEEACGPRLAGWALLGAAVATSIDAAAAGVMLPVFGEPILTASLVIGLTTALLCYGGVLIGQAAGARLGRWAELFGGVVLIGLGLKIFIQHQFLGG